MLAAIFIWTLLTQPKDRLICSMWVSNPPTLDTMAAAGCNWPPDMTHFYVWRAFDWRTGNVVCQRPASELPGITCSLIPLDDYLLQVYQPGFQDLLCNLTITHAGPPTKDEIKAGCPGHIPAHFDETLAYSGPPLPTPTPAPPVCPMPQLTTDQLPANATALATNNNYQLLAGQLQEHYGNNYDLSAWQNQYDPDIYQAALTYQVPPRLLKGLFAQESQFWPIWNTTPADIKEDEVGLGRLTDAGADLVLRYSPDLFQQFCPQAMSNNFCQMGYYFLTDDQRYAVRSLFRHSLNLYGSPRPGGFGRACADPGVGTGLEGLLLRGRGGGPPGRPGALLGVRAGGL